MKHQVFYYGKQLAALNHEATNRLQNRAKKCDVWFLTERADGQVAITGRGVVFRTELTPIPNKLVEL